MTANELPDRPADLANDPDLLGALLARWRPYLIVVIRRRLGCRELPMWATAHDEDDIAQEVLFRAARYARRYDPARGTFQHFLCLHLGAVLAEVFRLAARQRRSRRPRVEFRARARLARGADPKAPDPVAAAAGNDFWAFAGRGLDAQGRALLRLRHRDGLMKRQVAAALGLGENAADHQLRGLRDKLAADAALLNA